MHLEKPHHIDIGKSTAATAKFQHCDAKRPSSSVILLRKMETKLKRSFEA